jgi:hemerythrin
MSLQWREHFSAGIARIDERNKELFHRSRTLQDAIDNGNSAMEFPAFFAFLDEYTTTYFLYEEQVQKQYGYPHLEFHRKEHVQFRNDIEKIKIRIAAEGFSRQAQLLTSRTLNRWIVQHICNTDTALADFFNRRRNRAIPVPGIRLPNMSYKKNNPPSDLGDPFYIVDANGL